MGSFVSDKANEAMESKVFAEGGYRKKRHILYYFLSYIHYVTLTFLFPTHIINSCLDSVQSVEDVQDCEQL